MRILFLLIFAIISGCGYRIAESQASRDLETITVPYVIGDFNGQLTNAMILQLSASGAFHPVKNGGALILKMAVVSNVNEKIGYQYDREDVSGKLKKNLIPTEGRKNICVQVTLVEAASDDVIVGPIQISANADFDYVNSSSLQDQSFIDSDGKRVSVISFSQGQLDTIEGAQDDVLIPVFRHLAEKIVDGILRQMTERNLEESKLYE